MVLRVVEVAFVSAVAVVAAVAVAVVAPPFASPFAGPSAVDCQNGRLAFGSATCSAAVHSYRRRPSVTCLSDFAVAFAVAAAAGVVVVVAVVVVVVVVVVVAVYSSCLQAGLKAEPAFPVAGC